MNVPSYFPSNFDFRISKQTAEFLIANDCLQYHVDIMCKEYGDDDDWCAVTKEDLNPDGTFDNDLKTFEIWLSPQSKSKGHK